MSLPGVRGAPGGIEVDVQVVPRASREGVGPVQGERVKVRITAPPVDGAANEALRALLSRCLDVPRGSVTILRGETGRKKTVRIQGDAAALSARLGALLLQEKTDP